MQSRQIDVIGSKKGLKLPIHKYNYFSLCKHSIPQPSVLQQNPLLMRNYADCRVSLESKLVGFYIS